MKSRSGNCSFQDRESPKRLRNLELGNLWLDYACPRIGDISHTSEKGGDGTRTYSLDEEESKDKKERKTEGKYKAVVYTPSPAENEGKDFDSKPTTTMARFQEKLDNEINILDRESRKED